eukprot:UN08556
MCLLLMSIGGVPWDCAAETDHIFMYVMSNSVADLLKYWDCLAFVDLHVIKVLDAILCYEEYRISLQNIKKIVDNANFL